ncbi:metallophosphoesterase [Hymenobacter mucosus]|uniref:Por secretion system C-terminal sorting domain-containing protein n=1 Tax=Hymenobacter mucosus TaxID=1411120 RepID=A0A238VXC8_9BACT|nr:metallophosphoesterase [Hymenobacter mucosus]SNR38946.1 Por secretion system C-terminal sorting domain-containing protein [Hymenobacter mucosus]
MQVLRGARVARQIVFILLLSLSSLASLQAQRFAVVGDFGSGRSTEGDVAKLINSWQPEFIITMGDNNYERGSAATIDANIGQFYHSYINNYKGSYGAGSSTPRFFPSLGNHDLYTSLGQPYFDYFTLPGNERYYDFVRGNVHFFVLNSDETEPDGNTSESVQARWLRAGLAAATEPWKVVYMHHAPYSSGPHGSTVALQWPYRAWGASVVLAGHDHQYERLQVDSLTYIVNGLGGHSRYSTLAPVPGSRFRYTGNYGAMRVQASPDSLHFAFITRSGQLIEQFTLRQPVSTEILSVLPNPFTTSAKVTVQLPTAGPVVVRVVSASGQEVARLYEGALAAGSHVLRWNRQALPQGVYYVQLLTEGRRYALAVQVQ